MIGLEAAIAEFYPDATWSISGDSYDDLWWSEENKDPKPTKEELKKLINKIKKNVGRLQYVDMRKEKYPTIEDQIDMIWHAIDNGEIPGRESTFFKTIEDIKLENPKK